MSNERPTVIQIAARHTQMVRRLYWSTRFGGYSDLRIRLAADGLRVAEANLVALCGSAAKARAAEVAYIESCAGEAAA